MAAPTEANRLQIDGHSTSLLHEYGGLLQDGHFLSPILGGSLSIKTALAGPTGRPVEALLLYEAGMPQGQTAVLRLDSLRALVNDPGLESEDLAFELEQCRLRPDSAAAHPIALLHAALASPVVLFSSHKAFLALGCLEDWSERLDPIFAQPVHKLPYAYSEQQLSGAVRQVPAGIAPIFARYRGLIVQAETAPAAYQCIEELAGKAARCFGSVPASPRAALDSLPEDAPLRRMLGQLRQNLSERAGHPLLLRLLNGCEDGEISQQVQAGPVTAAGTRLFGSPAPALFNMQIEEKPFLGVAAPTLDLLEKHSQILQQSLDLLAMARPLGKIELIPEAPEFAAHVQRQPVAAERTSMFAGEVALVTGAASGIGKACALSLLERGSAVVALDISESVRQVSASPGYLGLVCDLTDEPALIRAVETCVRLFGGLDMLILNAGVFPPSRNLSELSLDFWRSVMDINLDANVSLLRECFPLLQCAPKYGRVIINASRNVPAPGPGAAAYSASKAALTQLGRVAALEWGKSRVRINTIHPHAVFDTGIWTEDVLKSRAAKYGVTVEEYKTNNILGVELTSRDVGELVAEMCGPLFEKITGAQIPVDGGSDRVI